MRYRRGPDAGSCRIESGTAGRKRRVPSAARTRAAYATTHLADNSPTAVHLPTWVRRVMVDVKHLEAFSHIQPICVHHGTAGEAPTGLSFALVFSIWIVVLDLVVGAIARPIMPGKHNLGLILTAVLGIVGAYVAPSLGN